MANDFLRLKWQRIFRTFDMNQDKLITIEDADIFSGNFCKNHQFPAERTVEVHTKIRRFWKEWALRGGDSVDEETFVTEMEKAYTADKATFREDARSMFGLVVDVVDINRDRLISEHEFEVMMKSTTFKHYDKAYMEAYPQIKPGYISLDVYLDVFVEFVCNDDKDNITLEKPRHFGYGMMLE